MKPSTSCRTSFKVQIFFSLKKPALQSALLPKPSSILEPPSDTKTSRPPKRTKTIPIAVYQSLLLITAAKSDQTSSYVVFFHLCYGWIRLGHCWRCTNFAMINRYDYRVVLVPSTLSTTSASLAEGMLLNKAVNEPIGVVGLFLRYDWRCRGRRRRRWCQWA